MQEDQLWGFCLNGYKPSLYVAKSTNCVRCRLLKEKTNTILLLWLEHEMTIFDSTRRTSSTMTMMTFWNFNSQDNIFQSINLVTTIWNGKMASVRCVPLSRVMMYMDPPLDLTFKVIVPDSSFLCNILPYLTLKPEMIQFTAKKFWPVHQSETHIRQQLTTCLRIVG